MNQSFKAFRQIFLRGLFTFLPIAVTIYILYAGIVIMESMLGTTIQRFFPSLYVPGLGFLLTTVFIFMLGLLLNNLLTASFFGNLERQLMKVPFIKAIYSPLKDLMNLFSQKGSKDLKSVVLVEIGNGDIKALGLITRDNFSDLGLGNHFTDRVAVFIPFSYGLGGYTLLVHRSKITEIDMPAEKAMSLAITGWVKAGGKNEGEGHP
ncbi:DUF502 domain-containing protein [Bdellovibrio sp. HCB337]|uniref:DUF502 domain-containing protein n=1 Tax=Bdellovibrio sp. HCB337 TaxID=3394358 RepID=UPI0039A6372F